MTAQELEQLRRLLIANPVDFAAPPVQVRPFFEGMLASLPADESHITSERSIGGVAGTWMDGDDESILLYLHGGAYTIGSSTAYRSLATALARGAGTAMFAPDYRLAPEHPHPAALDDALAVYRGLRAEGFAAADITVVGDSAGGGLTIALLVAIRDAGLEQPARAVVLSPWADLSLSGPTVATKADTDPSLTAHGLAAAAAHYLADLPATTPSASPLFADLHGLPPLLIEVGGAEILLSDATRLAAAAAEAGSDVRLHVWADMPHVWALFAPVLSEGRDLIAEVSDFIAAAARVEVGS